MRKPWNVKGVLGILDACSAAFTFPVLDNGYVYPAAARLSLHADAEDWAIVIETFGYSPREAYPSVVVQTFASRLFNRSGPERFVSRAAYDNYLKNNPHNEFRSGAPFDVAEWQRVDDEELVAEGAQSITLRGTPVRLPALESYAAFGIELVAPPRVQVFELCRALAALHRDQVLATPAERRQSLLPSLRELLVLDEWRHPEIVERGERPSDSEAFQMLAAVVLSGDVSLYRPSLPPNTHWKHWPAGGTL
jgi:hypothetical protein